MFFARPVPAYQKRARHICQTRRYFTQGVVSKHTQRGVKNTARCRVAPRITAERPQKHGTSLIKPRQPLSYPFYTAITCSQGLHAVVDRGCRVPGKNSKSVKTRNYWDTTSKLMVPWISSWSLTSTEYLPVDFTKPLVMSMLCLSSSGPPAATTA